ncbi:hypothetical protein ACHAXR_012050 [Thalassiosira sp. AJA248-18]
MAETGSAETSPLLALSLAIRRQRRAARRQSPQERELLRQNSRSPFLPVIHEEDQSSSASGFTAASHVSSHSCASASNAAAITAASSSPSTTYANFNSMSRQIVWPPNDDDSSWPPSNNRADNDQEMVDYGSIQGCYFVESEDCYPSSSPSSSSDSSGSTREQHYRRYYSSRRYRYIRSLIMGIFALSFSAAVWLPLLQQYPTVEQDQQYSSDTSSSPPKWVYFKHHKYYDDDDENDDKWDSSNQDDPPSNSSSSYPTWYRHRHFGMGGEELVDGSNLSSIVDEGSESQIFNPMVNASTLTNITFADLAANFLTRHFQTTVDLCMSTIVPSMVNGTTSADEAVTTTSVMPGEVYLLRKQILKTRDLLDVFSPVYSKHSSLDDYEDEASREHISWGDRGQKLEMTLESDTHGKAKKTKKKKVRVKDKTETSHKFDGDKIYEIKDMWKTLRRFLDNGYTLLGDFQDLDRANINYTPEQRAQYQLLVWQWNDEFMTFVDENRDHISLYLSLPCKKKHPRSKNTRCRHTHSHSSHLFWGSTPILELPDGKMEATPVLLRLWESQLKRAEMYLLQAMTHEHVFSSPGNATKGSVHEVYHNLRKELRSFLDEVDLFGTLTVPSSSGGGTTSSSLEQEQIDQSLYLLKRTRKHLGDLNDDYVAYSMYIEWNEYPGEQLRLQKVIETRWDYFRIWVKDVELLAKIQLLRDKMDPEALLIEYAVQENSTDEKYRSSNPIYSLESFLVERKANPTKQFVIGNDAGDADSIVSAISLAYVESIHSDDQLTPIVSISKATFADERPDVNLLFRLAGIDDSSSKLLFIDDLNELLEDDEKEGFPSPTLSLVDHNTLNKSLQHYSENLIVTEIVDHHKDKQQYKRSCAGKHRNIAYDHGRALVASTTTLVAERLQGVLFPYPPSIGTLLLGVILLDSVNLDESIGKVTQRDRDAVSNLLLHTDWSKARPSSYLKNEDNGDITIDTNRLFHKLQRAKYDTLFWGSFSAKRALGYDYKDFHGLGFVRTLKKQGGHETNFGISSVLMPGLDLVSKEGFYNSTLAFMQSKQIPLLGIMFAFYDERDVFHRQLAFVCMDQTISLRELVSTLLTSSAYKSVDLQLEEVQLPKDSWRENVCLFDQNNLAPSRKQIGPMLETFLTRESDNIS